MNRSHLLPTGSGAVGAGILVGRYRDRVFRPDGSVAVDGAWRSNLIVSSAWVLLSGLLANERGLTGLSHWAVGEGDSEWDSVHTPVDPAASRLVAELDRVPVGADQIRYLDRNGRPQLRPSARLEVRARFSWQEADRTLREFGLFGGDATERAGSGALINCVIHPRIDLPAGTALERRLLLTFRPEDRSRWLEVPDHWLGREVVTVLDGVGPTFTEALDTVRVRSVRDLALLEPSDHPDLLPFVRLVELRSKARLSLRTADELSAGSGFHRITAWEVIVTPVDQLARSAGSSLEEAARVREKISALELTLDHPFLRRVTVGELLATSIG